ncbi:uncharacterized protein Dvar_03520 [Desulfosarcina variabilis str. Montpellier]
MKFSTDSRFNIDLQSIFIISFKRLKYSFIRMQYYSERTAKRPAGVSRRVIILVTKKQEAKNE